MFYQKTALNIYDTIHKPQTGILRPHVDSLAIQAYWLGTWYHESAGGGINPNFVLPWTLPDSVLVFLVARVLGTQLTSTLTFNSESYTRLALANSFGTAAETAHYYRVNPTPGAGQLTTIDDIEFWVTAYLLTGVNQSTPVADSATVVGDTTSPMTATVTSSVKGLVTYSASSYVGGEIDPLSSDGLTPKQQQIYTYASPFQNNLLPGRGQGIKRSDGAGTQVTWTYASTSGACASAVSWSPA